MTTELTRLIDQFEENLDFRLKLFSSKVKNFELYQQSGWLISAIGCILIARIAGVKIGDLCRLKSDDGSISLIAEVIAINDGLVKLMPYGSLGNIGQNMLLYKISSGFKINIGDDILGKVVDGFGSIIGALHDTKNVQTYSNGLSLDVISNAPDPLSRPLLSKKLITGVKAIDLFNTCALGQRIGIFAGPGMGKTTLLGMIIRNTQADVMVVCLIGERGREVREFIDLELTEEIRQKCVVVVATSDKPPVEQVKCAYVAQTIAEYFRTQGKNVVLLVDSITRFARAQREVGLSAGEPPTRGGYPPSVFLSFPRLMERAGNDENGSITAFYTVLTENQDVSKDPIADEVKSILDGHLILSRQMAERGQFPAIDILSSLSRIADRVIDDKQLNAARHLRLLLSKYRELEFLIRVGEYKPGQDKLADEAVNKYNQIVKLLKQDSREKISFDDSLNQLLSLNG